TGFAFLFAPHYHPATRAIAPVRAALGVRTVFNILGPLVNPAQPPLHLVGAFSLEVARLLADTFQGLPIERTFVVHGAAGWDEPTPIGPFTLFDVRPGRVERSVRAPADYGLAPCRATDLAGGDAQHNAAALRAVLESEDQGAHRDCLLLGAALALEVAGVATEPHAAIAFLDDMAAGSRARAAAARRARPQAELERAARAASPPPPLQLSAAGFDLIAELKLRSPAAGQLRGADENVPARVGAYARAGAAAISVLTEPSRFAGSLEHLAEAAAALAPLAVPAMRKDFLVDPYQLLEARAAGAGGVLIIL